MNSYLLVGKPIGETTFHFVLVYFCNDSKMHPKFLSVTPSRDIRIKFSSSKSLFTEFGLHKLWSALRKRARCTGLVSD